MKNYILLLALFFTSCATTQPHYIAPNTSGVTKAVNSAHSSVSKAHQSTADAKDEIKQAIVENGEIKQKLEQLRKHHE